MTASDAVDGSHPTASYLDELSVRMDAITEAHGATNFERVAKEAHPLKSSSAEGGALRLSKLATALEAAAQKGDKAALEHELTTLVASPPWWRSAKQLDNTSLVLLLMI
jgi:HPt (histidine-containing phosphotransfer) domain-containing protein